MRSVNIHSTKTHLSKLIEQVFDGEEVIICKSGKPMAKLIKCVSPTKARIAGRWRGKVYISSDFDCLPKNTKASLNSEKDI